MKILENDRYLDLGDYRKIEYLEWLVDRYRDLLMQIAYPRRGTEEENKDIYDAAKLIQDNFTLQHLRGE